MEDKSVVEDVLFAFRVSDIGDTSNLAIDLYIPPSGKLVRGTIKKCKKGDEEEFYNLLQEKFSHCVAVLRDEIPKESLYL